MDQLHFGWTVFSSCSLVCPHATGYLGLNLEAITVSRQWANMDMFWAWTGELITIFMSHCHCLLFHFFFVELYFMSFFLFFPSFPHLCLTSLISYALLRHGSSGLGSWMGRDYLAEVSKYQMKLRKPITNIWYCAQSHVLCVREAGSPGLSSPT